MTQTKVEQRGTKHDTTVRTLTMFMQKYLSSLLLMLNYESCNNISDMPQSWHNAEQNHHVQNDGQIGG